MRRSQIYLAVPLFLAVFWATGASLAKVWDNEKETAVDLFRAK
jgi:predicted nicotinamide N-methyase